MHLRKHVTLATVVTVGLLCTRILIRTYGPKLLLVSNGDQPSSPHRTGPFKMPIKGQAYALFQPFYDMDDAKKGKVLIAPPQEFIKTFEERISWVDNLISFKIPRLKNLTTTEHATYMYIELMKSFVAGSVFNDAELSTKPKLGGLPKTADYSLEERMGGRDWTYAGDTMTGWARLDNIYNLLRDVIKSDIKGDYIETGVWRGGASVFARAAIQALEPNSTRVSYVCDSFHGLPPGERNLDKSDKNWDHSTYLEVSSDIVANNFIKYGMLDSNVVFAKGFFNETMPPLSKKIDTLSVMRLDGDMYESTVDVLYNLYDKLSIEGYVIMDDWFGFPSRTACLDFFEVHGIHPTIIPIDKLSAYWKKTENVDIQYWRYQTLDFKPNAG